MAINRQLVDHNDDDDDDEDAEDISVLTSVVGTRVYKLRE